MYVEYSRVHTKRQVIMKMNKFKMFITAVCVLFLIKLRWPKNKSKNIIISFYLVSFIFIRYLSSLLDVAVPVLKYDENNFYG